ncbi:Mn transporter [Nocardioides sp. Root122]|nr:Mn transporter [Nocardioides sp. Root122]
MAAGAAALLAVVGPGLLAGLSDDDPPGITTYSVLGAEYGYQLLWVLLVSTAALVLFHDLGARMGVATGQGLLGLVRDRYGVRVGASALVLLLVANVGTACAEYAGLAAGFELIGIPRQVSVPTAAVVVSVLVLRGRFHRIEHMLMALAAVFVTYVAAGLVVGPDWTQAAQGLLLPTMPIRDRDAWTIVVATVGTTLAPWGLSFIQSYAVDKKLTATELRFERVDVVTGSLLTGVIGFFVVVTCAETLHVGSASIDSAADAADALAPLAGRFAGGLFAVGLIGAALLAAAILPLSTAYSVCEFTGHEGALDDGFRRAPVFYATFVATAATAAGLVLVPHLPLVPVLVLSQVVNAVLLLPLLLMMQGLSRDPDVMGDAVSSSAAWTVRSLAIGFIALCVLALVVLSLT